VGKKNSSVNLITLAFSFFGEGEGGGGDLAKKNYITKFINK